MDLNPQASSRPARFENLIRLARVDSTNSYLARAFGTGAPEGLVVVAEEQEAGRGRRGRTWVAPPASGLLCSVLFRPQVSAEHFHLFSSILGLSARESIRQVTGIQASLKWPNDVLIGEKKVAGILAELLGRPEVGVGLVVGIGLNVSWPNEGLLGELDHSDDPELQQIAKSATSLELASGRVIELDEVLSAMLGALDHWFGVLSRGDFGHIMDAYRSACSTIGHNVEVIQATTRFSGRAISIGDDGRLMVEHNGTHSTVETADVVHLRQI